MESASVAKDDYFKFDVEAHLWPDISDLVHFPGMKWGPLVIEGLFRMMGILKEYQEETRVSVKSSSANDPDTLIARMDKYGVDMACVLPTSGWGKTHSRVALSNSYVMTACEKYPERLAFVANVGPITVRGIEHAVWELDYLIKEKNCQMLKMYHPEDTYINDRQLWPFYQKVSDLGIPVCIHLGWPSPPPNRGKYSQTMLLDDVATDFPDMKIIAYHAGWPDYHHLNLIASNHPNVYIGLNGLLPWCITAPRRAAEIIGEAIQFAGVDKVLFGTDYANSEVQLRYCVEGFRDIQIPQDLQEGYGFAPISDDERRKIFGLNLAKLLGIEAKRKVPRA